MAGVLLWHEIIIQDYERVEEAYNQALRNPPDESREMYRAYYGRYKGFDPSNLKEKIPNGTLKQFQKSVAELGLELPESHQGHLSRIKHLYAQTWLEAQNGINLGQGMALWAHQRPVEAHNGAISYHEALQIFRHLVEALKRFEGYYRGGTQQ